MMNHLPQHEKCLAASWNKRTVDTSTAGKCCLNGFVMAEKQPDHIGFAPNTNLTSENTKRLFLFLWPDSCVLLQKSPFFFLFFNVV